MGGDDHLPALLDRVDDARDEIGEALANSCAGFKEQRFVIAHRGSHGAGHLLLLRAVFELERALQPAVLRKCLRHQRRRLVRGRRGGARVVAESDHRWD